jgi:hypothetical protein
MVPFLIGPIDISSSFMMVTLIDNIPYVLVTRQIAQSNQIIYALEDNLNILLDPNNTSEILAILNVTGSLDTIQFKNTIVGGGFGTNSIGQLINIETPDTFVVKQSQFANWNPPDIFLTSTDYTITQSNGNKISVGTISNPTFNFLPIIWYFPCPQNSSSCCNLNTPASILLNWFCLYDSTKDWCQNDDDPDLALPITDKGWTNFPDCTIGNFYTYCPPNTYCGNNNCKGPCQSQTNDCNFNSNQYVCQINLNKAASNLKWWESPVFIGSMIGLGILIIFLIVIIFIVDRDGKMVKNNSTIDLPNYN